MPALVALRLFFDGTLPQDRGMPVGIAIDGSEIGRSCVVDLTCASTDFEYRPVTLRFRRVT